jgi:tetratricopeptide (TPR) repeat protein
VGRYDEALAELEQAVRIYGETGHRPGVYRATAQIGWAHFKRGTAQEGLTRVQPLLESCAGSKAAAASAETAERAWAPVPPRDVAVLSVVLAHLYWGSGQYGECLAASERAVARAREAGDERLLAEAQARWGSVLRRLGQGEKGCRVLEEAVARAEASGDLSSLGVALEHIEAACRCAGEFAQYMAYLRRDFENAERVGDPTWIGLSTLHLGEAAFLLGEWGEARAYITRGADLIHSVGASYLAAYPPLRLGALSLAEGDWEAATRHLEDCIALASRIPHLGALRAAQGLLAERDLWEGRPHAARARLVPLLDRPGLEETDVTGLLPTLAWAYLEVGAVTQAAAVSAQAIRRLRAENDRVGLVNALRVQALVSIGLERWDKAEASLQEALALAQRMPYPYAEGRLLSVYGLLSARRGEQEAARERLEVALAIFRRLGARKDIERTEQALSMLQNAPPHVLVPALPSTRQGLVAGAPAGRRLSRTQRQAWALEHLRTAGPLSPRAYATALGVSVDTALRDLQELVGRGLVRAAGTTKDRRYVLAGDAVASSIHRTAP